MALLFILLFGLLIFGLGIAFTIFWIMMIIDCVKNEPSTGNDKVVWLLLLIFTHGLGAMIYYFVRVRPRRNF